jgi:hypothetical protein
MRSADLIVHYELFTMGLVLIMKFIVGRVRSRMSEMSGFGVRYCPVYCPVLFGISDMSGTVRYCSILSGTQPFTNLFSLHSTLHLIFLSS